MYKQMYPVIFAFLLLAGTGCTDRNASTNPNVEPPQVLRCSKNTDCKGEKICAQGACTNPTRPVAATSPAEAQRVQSTATDQEPQFKDYPSGPTYTGPTASLANKSDEYRTENSTALAKNPVVFASEYVISTIGCGTGCIYQKFLSKRTGEQLNDILRGEDGERIKAVKPDSLLVITAAPDYTVQGKPKFYAYFYVLKNGKLERIFKKETKLPECKGTESYCIIDSPYGDD